jgi:acetyl-CoA acetyltransferase
MPDPVITDALPTPIGRYGGVISSVRPDDLAARVLRAYGVAIMCIGVGQGMAAVVEQT